MKRVARVARRIARRGWGSAVSLLSLLLWDWWHTRVLLLNYTADEPNHGCVATSLALIRLIRERHPGCVVRVQPVSYRPPRITLPLDWEAIQGRVDEYVAAERWRFRFFRWAHVIVLNGEGSIHDYAEDRLNQLALSKLLQVYVAKTRFRKTVTAVNQTLAFTNPAFGRVLGASYEPLDHVAVRDACSLETARQLGLARVRQAADAAFLAERGDPDRARRYLQRHGLASGFVAVFLTETIGECPPARIAGLLRALRDQLHRDVAVCATTAPDLRQVEAVAGEAGIPLLGMELSPGDLVAVLAEAGLVLSGRYHGCVFAFVAGTPLLPFTSNTHKIEGLMRLMDYPVTVRDYARDSTDRIVDGAADVLQSADLLSAGIRRELDRMRALARVNGEWER